MKQLILTLLFIPLFYALALSQQLTQTVRGTVIDIDNRLPLAGAEVIVLNSNSFMGTTTDLDGKFRLDDIPIGRINLGFRYLGYENASRQNVVVNSGKEVFLEIEMEESAVKMEEVVILASKDKGAALNDMALLSSRSISAEETNRYAGGFNDPSRILSNFAGINNTQDGSNDIIVRGNSPKYVQWRLEGIQITNPNHFADQSAVGGAISTLNNNLLGTSDFYTGAFTPEFGDVLSGVYDVKMRAGNNENSEYVFGFGLLGMDLTLEGPFKKGYGGSYLFNYRYSTASLLDEVGLLDVGGIPRFQDAAFKVLLPTKNLGVFSIFGLGGLSSFYVEDNKPSTWVTVGDNGMKPNIIEDYDKRSYLFNIGINHTLPIKNNSFLKTSLLYSNEGIKDDVYEKTTIRILDENNELLRDSVISTAANFKSRLNKTSYRGALTYNHKINANHKLQIGSKLTVFDYENAQSQFQNDESDRMSLLDFDEHVTTVRTFVSWKYRVNENLSLVSGFHNMNVLLNSKSTFEPRVALKWNMGSAGSFSIGYGKHSTMEAIHNYFAKVEQPDGSIIEPNRDLGLLKSDHFVLGYEKRFGKNIRAKAELYYQNLYDLPVENNDTSYYATINEGLEFRYVDLVNEGRGKNYGAELTLERFFKNNFYYLINGSIFQSKYIPLDGVERNTQYNSNYLVNILFGKEFENLGKKKNQTLSLNAKVFFSGGKRIIPLLRDDQGNLAVDAENGEFWDYEKAYEGSIEDLYYVTTSLSYKWNKPKATHELFLNLDNLTNTKGRSAEYYDENEPGSIGYVAQFGLFPNLMYRVYF